MKRKEDNFIGEKAQVMTLMERRFIRKSRTLRICSRKREGVTRVVPRPWIEQGQPLSMIIGEWEGVRWYDDKRDEFPIIWEEAPRLIIYDSEEEARRADVLDMEGVRREVKLTEEVALVLTEWWSVSYSIDDKVMWYWDARMLGRVGE